VPWHCEADRSRMRSKPGAAQGATKGSRGVVGGSCTATAAGVSCHPLFFSQLFSYVLRPRVVQMKKVPPVELLCREKNVLDLWIINKLIFIYNY